ncbi:hypothetical protein LTR94_030315, partial [Friedmanniomyces endolithicus]
MGGWFLSTGIGNNLSGIFASHVSGESGMSVASALGGYSFGFWSLLGGGVLLLLLALFLIAIGLLAVAAGSPASAMRYSGEHLKFEPLHYFWRQTIWVAVSLPVLFGVSMLPVQLARRMALLGAAVCIACLVLMPFIGMTVNGAKRWIGFGFAQFQPSEFLKPFFVVTVAWLLSLKSRDQELPVTIITAGLTGVIALLLMLQPDFGQTVIFCLIWLAL